MGGITIPRSSIAVGEVYGVAPAPTGSDQSAAVQAVIDANDVTVLQNGTYVFNTSLDPHADGKEIRGMGEQRTYLSRGADVPILDMSGTGSSYANHRHFNKVRDLSLIGGSSSYSEPLMKNYYCDNMTVSQVSFFSAYGEAIRAVEWWDSHIDNVVMDGCGSDTDGVNKPALNIMRSESSGFGSSQADGCNHLNFKHLRIESWRRGAIRIGDGSGDECRDINFHHLKTETFAGRGTALRVASSNGLMIDDWYSYIGGFASGYSTAMSGLYASSLRDFRLGRLRFATDSDAGLADSALWFDGGCTGQVGSVLGILGAALVTALVRFSSGTNFIQLDGPIGYLNNPGGSAIYSGASDSSVRLRGSGSPEGAVGAQVGSTWQRSDGGAGTSFYVKESGTGNTGWVAK